LVNFPLSISQGERSTCHEEVPFLHPPPGSHPYLNPPFEKKFACRVDVIAVGTGKALKIGEMGDSDVVFVHSRPAEDKFVAAGHGVNRRDVMYNDFIIIGPAKDPAGIRGTKDAKKALAAIASHLAGG